MISLIEVDDHISIERVFSGLKQVQWRYPCATPAPAFESQRCSRRGVPLSGQSKPFLGGWPFLPNVQTWIRISTLREYSVAGERTPWLHRAVFHATRPKACRSPGEKSDSFVSTDAELRER